MKILKILLLILGFYILFITVKNVGIQNIYQNILNLKMQLVPLLFVYPVIFALDTMGWAYSFPKSLPKHVPFWELYRIRIIGETLNAIIPWAASLGGEPVKVLLLKKRHDIPTREGYASILIVHTTFWISLNLFVIGALWLTFKSFPLTPVLWHSVLAFLIVLGIVALLLLIGLHFGVFENIHTFGEIFKWWGDKSKEKKEKFLALDSDIKKFYTKDPRRFVASTIFNFLGWLTGAVEVYIIGNALGMNLNWTEAWLFEALIQVLRIMTFFIPSSIGAQEGGIVLIFLQFGFEKSIGITFAIIRRIREILWIAVGLFLWIFLKERASIKNTD